MVTRAQGLDALLPQVEGKPVAMVHLARLLRAEGQHERALELCLRALAVHDPEVQALAADVLSTDVPSWHFSIVRDAARNAAYEAALRRAVYPGCRVLEIGAGTGLLAMMAVRAGSAEVITCESDPVVAQVARTIIGANGYTDCVRVVAKHSTALDPVGDLGGRADLLVSEIVSNNLIGEGVLPVIEHAVDHLLKPHARIIPARGCIRIALAEDTQDEHQWLGRIADFDLSPFNRLAKPCRQIAVGDARLRLRSAPGDLFVFDFQSGGRFPAERAAVALTAHGGRVNGIAQWIALKMDSEDTYENCPAPGARSCWGVLFYRFEHALDCAPGQQIIAQGRHDRHTLHIWV